jgi:hypothetical protein
MGQAKCFCWGGAQTRPRQSGWGALFAEDCKAFERSVNKNPRDTFAWMSWGKALAEQAESAVLFNPKSERLLCDWARVLNFRVLRMPGEETDQLLNNAVGRFRMAEEMGADPVALLWAWGALLWAQARAVGGAESVRLLKDLQKRNRACLGARRTIWPVFARNWTIKINAGIGFWRAVNLEFGSAQMQWPAIRRSRGSMSTTGSAHY